MLLSIGPMRSLQEIEDILRAVGLSFDQPFQGCGSHFSGRRKRRSPSVFYSYDAPVLTSYGYALLRDLVRKDERAWDSDELKPYVAELKDLIATARLREQRTTLQFTAEVKKSA